MKKLILAISAIALFSTACNKANNDVTSSNITKQMREETESFTIRSKTETYVLNGSVVDKSTINFNDENLITLTGINEEFFTTYVFYNKANLLNFILNLSDIELKDNLEKFYNYSEALKRFVAETDAEQYYNDHGDMPSTYYQKVQEYKNSNGLKPTRAVGFYYDGCIADNGPKIPAFTYPVLSGWYDRISSIGAMATGGGLFELHTKTFFRGGFGWVNIWPGALQMSLCNYNQWLNNNTRSIIDMG